MKKSYIAGLLSIIAGGLGILGFLSVILFTVAGAGGMWGMFGGGMTMPSWFAGAVGGAIAGSIIAIIAGIPAIIGGLSAMRQKSWGLGLAGAICALFAAGSALGIAAIVLIVLGKNEFPKPVGTPPTPPTKT